MNLSDNPLYHVDTTAPRFDSILPEHAEPAIRAMLSEAEAVVSRIEQEADASWDGLCDPLYRETKPLWLGWGLVSHYMSVMNTDAWREAHDALQPDVVKFGLRVGQSREIYDKLKVMNSAEVYKSLEGPRQRIVAKKLQSAEMAGVGLPTEECARFNEIQQESSQKGTCFSNNVLDATKAFSLTLREPEDVAGMPESFMDAAAQAAAMAGEEGASREKGPWRVTLDAPMLIPFLKYSERRDLREKLYRAQVTRASGGELDNRPVLSRILELRCEKAALLGYDTPADVSLASKMAENVGAVDAMMQRLRDASYNCACREHEELLAFAAESGWEEGELLNWDIGFWSEKQRLAKYDFSEEELRQYFQFPQVLSGLFELSERLFGIKVKECTGDVPVWHPDVRFYRVSGEDGSAMASFYLDPYSRPETKRGGAWMNSLCSRDRAPDGTLQLPVVYLICNQSPPVGDAPSLMTFREVETLFHEFGHGLQHMLSTVEDAPASGVGNVEWDAVELPSQFMENWCYDHATLMGLSCHIETGEQLPETLFEKIIASRTYRAGSGVLRQLFFSVLDMELHARLEDCDVDTIDAAKARIEKDYTVVPSIPEDQFLCGFSHIFAGGYAAGYYSYKWAEVLSADAFATFEEAGLENESAMASIGRHFRDTVLSLGGGTHPMEVFEQFRGRKPTVEPLLRHYGLS